MILNYFFVDYGRRNFLVLVVFLLFVMEEFFWWRLYCILFCYVGVFDKGGVNVVGVINNFEWFGGFDFVFCGIGWK